KFEEIVSSTIDKKLLRPEVKIDMKLDLRRINKKFYNTIKRFGPFGPGNMRPVFLSENVNCCGTPRAIGTEQKQLKCNSKSGNPNYALAAIGFNLGGRLEKILEQPGMDIVYSLDENEWNQKRTLQLKLRDLR